MSILPLYSLKKACCSSKLRPVNRISWFFLCWIHQVASCLSLAISNQTITAANNSNKQIKHFYCCKILTCQSINFFSSYALSSFGTTSSAQGPHHSCSSIPLISEVDGKSRQYRSSHRGEKGQKHSSTYPFEISFAATLFASLNPQGVSLYQEAGQRKQQQQ